MTCTFKGKVGSLLFQTSDRESDDTRSKIFLLLPKWDFAARIDFETKHPNISLFA